MLYLRARYYSGAQGRFLTADAWPGDYTRPLSLNKWNYVHSNPINATDPTGRWCLFGQDVWPYDIDPCTPEERAAAQRLLAPWEAAAADALRPVYATIYDIGTDPRVIQALPPEFWTTGAKIVYFHNQQYAVVFSGRPGKERIWACMFVGIEAEVVAIVAVKAGTTAVEAVHQLLQTKETGKTTVGGERPGYSGPGEGWENTRPHDLVPGWNGQELQDVLASKGYQPPSQLVGAPQELKDTTKFNYVIDSEGRIWVSRSGHHADLVNGENVYGAGEIYIDQNGRIVRVNDQSGHYFPGCSRGCGPEFFPYMQRRLRELGIRVPDGVFVPIR